MREEKERTVRKYFSDEAKRDLIAAHQSGSERFEKEFDRTHSPYWEARNDLSKTIISLASGSIVLTVTFSSSLVGAEKANPWNYLLFGSWISFLLTIVAAVVSLWISTSLKWIPVAFDYQRRKITEAIERDSSPEEIVNTIADSFPKYGRANRWSGRFHHTSLITFIVALVLLGLFGWQRFAA